MFASEAVEGLACLISVTAKPVLAEGTSLVERSCAGSRRGAARTDMDTRREFLKRAALMVAVVLVLLRGFVCAADLPKPVKVFLFAGQSNMEGADAHRDRIDPYPDFRGAGAVQSNVLFVSLPRDGEAKAAWGPMVAGEPFGSEVTFARMVGSQEGGAIAIIKSAIGGTTMAYEWNPEAPENGQKLYPRTLRLVRESMAEAYLDRR